MSYDYSMPPGAEGDGMGAGAAYRNQRSPGSDSSPGGPLSGRGGIGLNGRSGGPSENPRSPEGGPAQPLRLDELVTVGRQEFEQVSRELEDIKLLVRQANTEWERANQRKTQTAGRVREMEARLETFARQEIRTIYLASNEAEMRTFMMNEQRERLRDKQQTYERYVRILQQLLDGMAALMEANQRGQENHNPAFASLARLVETQEQLRQWIAQRLHDGPAQSLANVVLSAEICERAMEHDMGRARIELANLKSVVNGTLQEARKFIFELRPMTLDDLGLVPTLKRYTYDVSSRSGVEVMFGMQGAERRFPSAVEVSLFRIAQEALSNVVTHAQASQAAVTVAVDEREIVLVVEDNGSGFDVDQALAEAASRKAVGLTNMYERAEMLGGRLTIESLPGRGTKVELVLQRPGQEYWTGR